MSSGGLVGVTWLDRRYDPDNLSYEAFAAISSDGGATFPNLQIASVASNPPKRWVRRHLQGRLHRQRVEQHGYNPIRLLDGQPQWGQQQDEVGGRIRTGSAPAWNRVCSPGGGRLLFGVAPVSASDVWAVGQDVNGQTLTEHWNGTSWNVVPGIDFDPNNSTFLTGVAAITATNAWAVGYHLNSPPSTAQTLIEQYCCWDRGIRQDRTGRIVPFLLKPREHCRGMDMATHGHPWVADPFQQCERATAAGAPGG